MLNLTPQQIIINIIVIVIALMVHEIAHAATALAFGDQSQKAQGRISLNPLRHIDPFGFIMLVVVGFGWAKPVFFNTDNMKHRNIAAVLVPLAGPFANFFLAILGFVTLKLMPASMLVSENLVLSLVLSFITLNLGLFIFNLLPFPPLDGSHLVMEAFFRDKPLQVMRFNQIGSLLLLGIFMIQAVGNVTIIPFGDWIQKLFNLGLKVFGIA